MIYIYMDSDNLSLYMYIYIYSISEMMNTYFTSMVLMGKSTEGSFCPGTQEIYSTRGDTVVIRRLARQQRIISLEQNADFKSRIIRPGT